jgi:hypothetical protein
MAEVIAEENKTDDGPNYYGWNSHETGGIWQGWRSCNEEG